MLNFIYFFKITMQYQRTLMRLRGLQPQNEKIRAMQSIMEIIYDNGEIYRGEVKNNMRHGNGQMIYNNGVVYEGLWENDNFKQVKIYTQE